MLQAAEVGVLYWSRPEICLHKQRWAQYIVWTILIARKVTYENDTDTCRT
jgi:hypothetical protein